MENIYKVLKGKAKEKISLGRPRCKLEKKNIKMDLKEAGCDFGELDRIGSG
jgi:hypothetical protein